MFFPNSNLVFIKEDGKFQASIESTIRVEDSESELQINRMSSIQTIVEKYYEDTRSNRLYQLDYEFLLKKGFIDHIVERKKLKEVLSSIFNFFGYNNEK